MRLLDTTLAVADAFLCLFIFFPLAIFHWRGTWQLQDVYFLPDNLVDSSWVSLAIGANLGLVELLTQPYLGGALRKEHRLLYFICSRLHLYIHGWAVMCFWRGVWNLMDLYLTEHWINSLLILVVCQIISFVTKTTRTNVGIPVSIMLDTDPDLLEPDTVFKINPEESIRYMLDCLFTQFIIILSSICIWRGIWNLCDAFLLPNNHFMSDVISLVVGLGCISIMFLLQVPLAWLAERLEQRSHMAKLVYEDVIFFIATWANLLLWRGAWDLCIVYVLPDPEVGSWICHWIGTTGLMALQVFNNVGLNGIERDGQYSGGEGLFPLQYLRVYLKPLLQKSGQGWYKVAEQEDGSTEAMLGQSDVPGDNQYENIGYSGNSTKRVNGSVEMESFLTASEGEEGQGKQDDSAVTMVTRGAGDCFRNGWQNSNGQIHPDDSVPLMPNNGHPSNCDSPADHHDNVTEHTTLDNNVSVAGNHGNSHSVSTGGRENNYTAMSDTQAGGHHSSSLQDNNRTTISRRNHGNSCTTQCDNHGDSVPLESGDDR